MKMPVLWVVMPSNEDASTLGCYAL